MKIYKGVLIALLFIQFSLLSSAVMTAPRAAGGHPAFDGSGSASSETELLSPKNKISQKPIDDTLAEPELSGPPNSKNSKLPPGGPDTSSDLNKSPLDKNEPNPDIDVKIGGTEEEQLANLDDSSNIPPNNDEKLKNSPPPPTDDVKIKNQPPPPTIEEEKKKIPPPPPVDDGKIKAVPLTKPISKPISKPPPPVEEPIENISEPQETKPGSPQSVKELVNKLVTSATKNIVENMRHKRNETGSDLPKSKDSPVKEPSKPKTISKRSLPPKSNSYKIKSDKGKAKEEPKIEAKVPEVKPSEKKAQKPELVAVAYKPKSVKKRDTYDDESSLFDDEDTRSFSDDDSSYAQFDESPVRATVFKQAVRTRPISVTRSSYNDETVRSNLDSNYDTFSDMRSSPPLMRTKTNRVVNSPEIRVSFNSASAPLQRSNSRKTGLRTVVVRDFDDNSSGYDSSSVRELPQIRSNYDSGVVRELSQIRSNSNYDSGLVRELPQIRSNSNYDSGLVRELPEIRSNYNDGSVRSFDSGVMRVKFINSPTRTATRAKKGGNVNVVRTFVEKERTVPLVRSSAYDSQVRSVSNKFINDLSDLPKSRDFPFEVVNVPAPIRVSTRNEKRYKRSASKQFMKRRVPSVLTAVSKVNSNEPW